MFPKAFSESIFLLFLLFYDIAEVFRDSIKKELVKNIHLLKNLRENNIPDFRTAFGEICFENRGTIPLDIHRR